MVTEDIMGAKIITFAIILTSVSFCTLAVLGFSLSPAIQIIIGGAFFVSIARMLFRHQGKIPLLFRFWVLMILIAALIALCAPSYCAGKSWQDVIELIIPFAITLSSYYLYRISDKQLRRDLILAAIVASICGAIIIASTGGLEITYAYRSGVSKNQTAPFFALMGLVAFVYYLFNNSANRYTKVILLIIFIICIAFAIINRARTTTLTSLTIVLILLFIKYRMHSAIVIPLICIIGIVCFSNQIEDIVQTSIIGRADVRDMNSITSGRTERNEVAARFIMKHPIIGAYEGDKESQHIWSNRYKIPHNYLIFKFVRYGFLLSIPYLAIYVAIIISVYRIIRCNIYDNLLLMSGFLLAYVTSITEYSAPFGPGTSFIVFYVLLGRTLYLSQVKRRHWLSLTLKNSIYE